MWGAHKADGRIAALNSVKVRAALRQSIDAQQVFEDYQMTHPYVSDNITQDRARARAWAMLHVKINKQPMTDVLKKVYADGYLLGEDSANEAIKKASVEKSLNKSDAYVDWGNWKPGNRAASLILRPTGAFEKLLAQASISSDTIAKAGYDRIGTALADSIAAGFSPSRAAKVITEKIGDPARALTIALTEQNRAISAATLNSYNEAGITSSEWSGANPCEICAPNEGAVAPLGEDFPSGDSQPPVHPNCRCALLPVLEDGTVSDTAIDDITDIAPEIMAPEDTPEPSQQDTWTEITPEQWVARVESERIAKGYPPANENILKILHDQANDAAITLQKGAHVIRLDKAASTVEKEHLDAFTKNFETALTKLPAWRRFDENGVERPYTAIITPLKSGDTLAYTYLGHDAIWFSPKSVKMAVEKSAKEQGKPMSTFSMPAQHHVNANYYDIAHELGHTVDSVANVDVKSKFTGALKRKFPSLWSRYAKTNVSESYAEVFAQWATGEHNALTKAYSEKFGWDLSPEEYKAQITPQWRPSTRTMAHFTNG